jgi:hypothetical protein
MNVSKFMKFVDLTQAPHDKEIIETAIRSYIDFQRKFQDVESEAIIYRISFKDDSITDSYVGHTFKPILEREYHHRKTCENPSYQNYNKKLYCCVRSHGGWSNIKVDVLEKSVMNRRNARCREQYWIDFYNPSLNKIDSCQK